MKILMVSLVCLAFSNYAFAGKCDKELDEFIKHTKFGSWNPPETEARHKKTQLSDSADGRKMLALMEENKKLSTQYDELSKKDRDLDDKIYDIKKENKKNKGKMLLKESIKTANLGLDSKYTETVLALHQADIELKKFNTSNIQKAREIKWAINGAQDKKLIAEAKAQLASNTEYQNYLKADAKYNELDKKERALREKLLSENQDPMSVELSKSLKSRSELEKQIEKIDDKGEKNCQEIFDKGVKLKYFEPITNNMYNYSYHGNCHMQPTLESWKIESSPQTNFSFKQGDADLAKLTGNELKSRSIKDRILPIEITYERWDNEKERQSLKITNLQKEILFNFNEDCLLSTQDAGGESCAKKSVDFGFKDDYLCRFVEKNKDTDGSQKRLN